LAIKNVYTSSLHFSRNIYPDERKTRSFYKGSHIFLYRLRGPLEWFDPFPTCISTYDICFIKQTELLKKLKGTCDARISEDIGGSRGDSTLLKSRCAFEDCFARQTGFEEGYGML